MRHALPLLLLLACTKQEPEPPADPVLLQAVSGAFFANPEVHPQIPVRVEAAGASAVSVQGPKDTVEAYAEEDGTWVAWLTTGTSGGQVTATATWPEGEETQASAELLVGTEGVQLTVLEEVGTTTTPRLLLYQGDLYATWCDRAESIAQCWARELDGAGRWQGEAMRLSVDSEDTLYARTAASDEGYLGVLYQLGEGLPYRNFLRIADFQGGEVLASQTLHEEGWQGTFGGDITWDGEAFAMAWRERSTTTTEARIRWQRVFPDGTVVGPITVAESGEGDPDVGFDPFVFVKLSTLDGAHLVTFVQYRYDATLDVDLPKARFAVLSGADGSVMEQGLLGGSGTGFDWDLEAHAGVAKGQLVALWSKDDLGSPENVIPTEIAARTFLTTGDPIELGASVEQAPDTRGEMALFDHPGHRAAMAWIDHRTYTEEGLDSGQIQLHVATLADTLQARPATVYPHARFYAGLADLGGVMADHNLILTWSDHRRDWTLAEMYVETVWVAP